MARRLAFANVQKALGVVDPNASDLPAGHMRLYQNYKPILEAGHYGIEVKQSISTASENLEAFNYDGSKIVGSVPGVPKNPPTDILPQKFDVVIPQFSLDPKIINSHYPPDGHADESRVLPHIVFNDPHIPWDRPYQAVIPPTLVVGPPPVASPPITTIPTTVPHAALNLPHGAFMRTNPTLLDPRNFPDLLPDLLPELVPPPGGFVPEMAGKRYPAIAPWFALVVFDPSELVVTQADAKALNIPGYNDPTLFAQKSLPATGAFDMTVGEYLSNVKPRINYEYGISASDFAQLKMSADPTKIIFPKQTRAIELFQFAVKFAFMSHVREVNTTGVPDAGLDEKGLFSICISHVTGLPVIDKPTTQVVHLVSVENFDHTSIKLPVTSDRIGMVSLFSWTYLAVPKTPINFKDTMINLANTKQMLCPPVPTLLDVFKDTSKPALKNAAQHLYDRIALGYTIGRWRTSTGEETAAFFRGPLAPVPTPWKPSVNNDWPASSNTGKDYQILDRDLGVMDLTYSSAWQLGKLLAIEDTVFNSALLRFRSLVHQKAANETRMFLNNTTLKATVISNLRNTVSGMHDIQNPDNTPVRNILPTTDKVAPPFSHPDVAPVFSRAVTAAVDVQTYAGQELYNDYKLGAANNSDWEIIHNWISDKLFLSGIPAHYLITDPTHIATSSIPVDDQHPIDPTKLAPEALRFFYIDDAWIDCLIDGALSVANHLEPVDDKVRRRIKDIYNVYLRTTIQTLPIKPPVPRYGFILRSALIKVMPDIRITVFCRRQVGPHIFIPDTTRKPLVRLTKLDDNTIFALLDCYPEEVHHIRLAQPPHQQRFCAAQDLGPPQVHTVKRLYTAGAPTPSDFGSGGWPEIPIPAMIGAVAIDPTTWYQPDLRAVNILQMASDLRKIVILPNTTTEFLMPKGAADSTIMALELNDNNYQIDFLPPTSSGLGNVPVQDRQLWVGTDLNDPSDPIPPATGPHIVFNPPILDPPILNPNIPSPPFSTAATLKTSSAGPPTTPRNIKLAAHSPQIIQQLFRPSLPVGLSQKSIIIRDVTPISAVPATTTAPRFLLTIHPSYRTAPPLPSVPIVGPPPTGPIYSPQDFIPTGSSHLINLVFSLSMQPGVISVSPPTPGPTPAPAPTGLTSPGNTNLGTPIFIPLRLSSITINIPLSSVPSNITDPEPLLNPPNSTGNLPAPTVKMLHNKRLIPSLAMSHSGIYSPSLTITLLPRSGATSLPLANVRDAGFQLSNCDVASVVKMLPLDIFGWGKLDRGVCKVSTVEEYTRVVGTGVFRGYSECVVVKRDGGDFDLLGNAV